MGYLLNNTSVDDLKSTISCATNNDRPFSVCRLRASIAAECQNLGPRKTIIKILEREIKRQEKKGGAE